jgi:nucleoid DNA-binding protein
MPEALGRGDVAGRVAAKLGSPQAAGRRALDAVLAALTEALGAGHTVTLTRFGTFAVRPIGARRAAHLGPEAAVAAEGVGALLVDHQHQHVRTRGLRAHSPLVSLSSPSRPVLVP